MQWLCLVLFFLGLNLNFKRPNLMGFGVFVGFKLFECTVLDTVYVK